MGTKFIPFNVNNLVRVKLTDEGRRIHRQQFRKLNATLKITSNMKYLPPVEDSDGWSSWQLWVLIETFGEHTGVCKQPFECDIEFEVSD